MKKLNLNNYVINFSILFGKILLVLIAFLALVVISWLACFFILNYFLIEESTAYAMKKIVFVLNNEAFYLNNAFLGELLHCCFISKV